MIRLCTTCLLLLLAIPAQASTEIGSVAIYSDGSVEKLLEKNSEWSVWQDQRKRLYKKANYPHFPILHYQKFPDPSEGYRQELVFGSPLKMQTFGGETQASYELLKTSKSSSGKKYWQCSFTGKGKYKLGSKKYKTQNYDCTRIILKKGFYPQKKEQLLLKYSPTLQVVVDRKRIDSKGNKKRVKLIKILKPEKATAKRIARAVYKIRNEK
jgi:hypothetical protein